MIPDPAYPILTLAISVVTALVQFVLPERAARTRLAVNVVGASTKVVVVAVMLWGVFHGHRYEVQVPLALGLSVGFHSDALSMLFATLSAVLWLLTTIYAQGYLDHGRHLNRFFGFFSLCVTATMGVAFADDLFTFLVFYELLTLATYPLVVHAGTSEALRAGRIYLGYTLTGGLLLFGAVVWLQARMGGAVAFRPGGVLAPLGLPPRDAIAVFAVLVVGLGVKAALVPLHGWLPRAMVAPAPVSALLHAVAVVKAGAFGIVRVVYDLFGVRYAEHLGVTAPLAALATITILYGSIQALLQPNLKRRLAYSTVSQVSYIVLGTAIVGTGTTVAALAHLVHQGLMKITLFFCAGSLAKHLHVHDVRELAGAGRRMPGTMVAFTIGALGMIGVPPTAGFVTKWYLATGAADEGSVWVVPVLIASTVLNALYFLPLVKAAWFDAPTEAGPPIRSEGSWLLFVPLAVSGALALAVGLVAGAPLSPLWWAELIAERELAP